MKKQGQARTFDEDELAELLDNVTAIQAAKQNAQPAEVMRVAFMLSFYAGLRVQEIAGLEWDLNIFNAHNKFRNAPAPVTDADGKVMKNSRNKRIMKNVAVLFINENIGKYGKARNIPIPPRLQRALKELRDLQMVGAYVIPSAKTGSDQGLRHRAHALKMRMNRLYESLGLGRASSHSGRRSFGTRAARRAELFDTSLVDVRDLMGHASIATTQKYVDPSDRQADLVDSIWEAA